MNSNRTPHTNLQICSRLNSLTSKSNEIKVNQFQFNIEERKNIHKTNQQGKKEIHSYEKYQIKSL